MALDAQVDEYLTLLKDNVYRDGQEYQDGTVALEEMTYVAQSLIKSRKIYYNRTKEFLNTRLVRLSLIKEQFLNLMESIQVQGKYDVFIKNAKELYDISATMDTVNGNINVTVRSLLKKINHYNREIEEVTNRLQMYSDILDYYKEADEILIELQEKISSLSSA